MPHTPSSANKVFQPASSTELADSPLQQLHSQLLDDAAVELYVKRDDLIHPQFGGNKWRKLKYNLIHAREKQYDTLLTFGGAWSNHIYATAAAARHFGFNSIGMIRGEEHTPLNTTLSFAKSCGMQLHYVDRARYRQKHQPEYLKRIKQEFGDVYLLPEGGSNELALKGCEEIIHEINDESGQKFDVICCASGTGATLAGLANAITDSQLAIGFSALKGGAFLSHEVIKYLNSSGLGASTDRSKKNWQIEQDFHFGGYAKIDEELLSFMKQFQAQYGFELDAVYTGKMFFGLFHLIESGYFKPGTIIIAIHSGGLQGNKGFNL
ncbi:MAG: pyridoxal-phosphate dependent enzyme [Gammaproteobacteria bacterium]|nr:pyridoxal-phosphate dependent enzyme [Gammaproteobacteria bacterium]